jgi:hypothetical protein
MGSHEHEHNLLSNEQNITRMKNKAEFRMHFTVMDCSKFLLLQYTQMYYTETKRTGIYLVPARYPPTVPIWLQNYKGTLM